MAIGLNPVIPRILIKKSVWLIIINIIIQSRVYFEKGKVSLTGRKSFLKIWKHKKSGSEQMNVSVEVALVCKYCSVVIDVDPKKKP